MVSSSFSIQQKIAAEIQKAKIAGTLQPDQLRQIIRAEALQAATEFRGGSTEVYLITKEVILQVVELLQDQPEHFQNYLVAVIEGMIEGFSWGKREAIASLQIQLERSQTQVDHQERALQDQTDQILNTVEFTAKQVPPSAQAAIESAVNALKNTEEMALLRQKYSDLRLQLSILRANLIAQYGPHYSEVKKHLEEAKFWYKEAQDQGSDQLRERKYWLKQNQTDFEKKVNEVETALAHQEGHVQVLLEEVWHLVSHQA